MTRFFFLSLFCHFSVFFLFFFFKLPEPSPKVFRAKVYLNTQTATKRPTITNDAQVNKNKKPIVANTKKLISNPQLPKIVNTSPLKLNRLDLENVDLNQFKVEETQPQIVTPTKLELNDIVDQQPEIKQLDINIERNIQEKKPIILNSDNTAKPDNKRRSVVENIVIQNYKNLLANIIRSNWNNSLQNTNTRAVIKTSIRRDGKLLEYNVIKKSNIISFDLSIVNALKISAPFPPFPDNYEKENEIFYFQFQGGGILISQ